MSQDLTRRGAIAAAAAAAAMAAAPGAAAEPATPYGRIGRMKAKPGQRDALIAILREGTGAMPGCIAYLVNADAADAESIWITEVWADKTSHAASLKLPAVQAAIAKGRPLIAGFNIGLEVAGTAN